MAENMRVAALQVGATEVIGSDRAANFEALTVRGVRPTGATLLPSAWYRERSTANPVIAVNATETGEQYIAAPILLSNGDIWIYVKGATRLYAYKSTDDGETFTIQNSGSPILLPGSSGAWDESIVLDAYAEYDEDTDTIHLFFKGRNASHVYGIGYATADGTDPTSFTKDAANPILTTSDFSTAFSGDAVTDLALSSVIRHSDTSFTFYGHYTGSTQHWFWRATGSDWDDINLQARFDMTPRYHLKLQEITTYPKVFKLTDGGGYGMLFTEGMATQTDMRCIQSAVSIDGETWTRAESPFLVPHTETTWEARRVHHIAPLKRPEGELLEVDGKVLMYYSGTRVADPQIDQVGLLRVLPTSGMRHSEPTVIPLISSEVTGITTTTADTSLGYYAHLHHGHLGRMARLVAILHTDEISGVTRVSLTAVNHSTGTTLIDNSEAANGGTAPFRAVSFPFMIPVTVSSFFTEALRLNAWISGGSSPTGTIRSAALVIY